MKVCGTIRARATWWCGWRSTRTNCHWPYGVDILNRISSSSSVAWAMVRKGTLSSKARTWQGKRESGSKERCSSINQSINQSKKSCSKERCSQEEVLGKHSQGAEAPRKTAT